MSQGDDPARALSDDEALEWIIAVQESPDDRELRTRFEQWRTASPSNAAAWDEATQVYIGIGGTRPTHTQRWAALAERRVSTLAPPVTAIRRRPQPGMGISGLGGGIARLLMRAALPAAAVLACVTFAGPELAWRWQADAMTGIGELREITLADGSHASLSPQSAISIAYTDRERRITLLRGQAWFDVRHESGRPFRVDARDIRTTDIGTTFEVGMTDDALHVAVAKGIVRVDYGTALRPLSGRLVTGQALAITSDGQVQGYVEAPALVGAWRDGQLAVQDKPMRDVVEALRPWYRGVIVVRSDALAERRVTGVYNLHDPTGAMEALAKAYDGRITRLSPWILMLSGN